MPDKTLRAQTLKELALDALSRAQPKSMPSNAPYIGLDSEAAQGVVDALGPSFPKGRGKTPIPSRADVLTEADLAVMRKRKGGRK